VGVEFILDTHSGHPRDLFWRVYTEEGTTRNVNSRSVRSSCDAHVIRVATMRVIPRDSFSLSFSLCLSLRVSFSLSFSLSLSLHLAVSFDSASDTSGARFSF